MKQPQLIIVSLLFLSLGWLPFVHAAEPPPADLASIEKEINDPKFPPQVVLEHLQAYILVHPKDARAHFLAGAVFDRMGYRELAEQQFKQSDRLDPSKPNSALNLFRLKVQNDELVAARELLQYVAKRYPEDPSVYLMRGLMLVHGGQIEAAESIYMHALATGKQTVGLSTALSVIRLKQHRLKEAVELADKDLAVNPRHASALLVKGEALFRLGRFDEAVPILEQAYHSNAFDKKAAARLLAQGYIHSGQYAKALPAALYNLSLAHERRELGRSKALVASIVEHMSPAAVTEGIAQVDEQLKDTLARPRLHFALGDMYDKLDQPQLGRQQYAIGLGYQPDYGRAWFRLAKDTVKSGEYAKALAYYSRAMMLEPADREIKANYMRFLERAESRDNDLAWRLKDWTQSLLKTKS